MKKNEILKGEKIVEEIVNNPPPTPPQSITTGTNGRVSYSLIQSVPPLNYNTYCFFRKATPTQCQASPPTRTKRRGIEKTCWVGVSMQSIWITMVGTHHTAHLCISVQSTHTNISILMQTSSDVYVCIHWLPIHSFPRLCRVVVDVLMHSHEHKIHSYICITARSITQEWWILTSWG